MIFEGIFYQYGFLIPSECEDLINLARHHNLRHDFRSESSLHVTGCRIVIDTPVTQLIKDLCASRAGVDYSQVGHVELIRYEEGFVEALHTDGPQHRQTTIVYLNEEYEGGRLLFPNIGLRLAPTVGAAASWRNAEDAIEVSRNEHMTELLTSGVMWLAMCCANDL